MNRRKGEPEGTHFRSERTVQINGRWFFLSRESEQPIGPFADLKKLETEIETYKKDMKKTPHRAILYHLYAKKNGC